MLDDKAFIRRIPYALTLVQRLEIDGLLTSSDLVFHAYARVRDVLTGLLTQEFANVPRPISLDLALNCWSIIDNLHTFVSFARRLPAKP